VILIQKYKKRLTYDNETGKATLYYENCYIPIVVECNESTFGYYAKILSESVNSTCGSI
jgi:hypothetical protein